MIDSMEQDHHARAAGHSHAHAHPDYGRAFAVGITLNLVYVAGEAIAGVLSGSLALIADAGHNLGDVLSLSLAWGAAVLSRRRPPGQRGHRPEANSRAVTPQASWSTGSPPCCSLPGARATSI